MNDTFILPLQELLQASADPKTKAWWEGYVKNSAPFLGVKMAATRAAVHHWHAQHVAGSLTLRQQMDLALALFQEKHTEEKLAGTLFLREILLPAGAVDRDRDLGRFADLFTSGAIYDWNVCDWFCVKVLGPLIAGGDAAWANPIAAWRDAANVWQARAALVAFVNVAENKTYYPLIEQSCSVLIRREERFAKTAVGWILREISRHDALFVDHVLVENIGYFSTESLKNATKYLSKDNQSRYRELRKGQT